MGWAGPDCGCRTEQGHNRGKIQGRNRRRPCSCDSPGKFRRLANPRCPRTGEFSRRGLRRPHALGARARANTQPASSFSWVFPWGPELNRTARPRLPPHRGAGRCRCVVRTSGTRQAGGVMRAVSCAGAVAVFDHRNRENGNTIPVPRFRLGLLHPNSLPAGRICSEFRSRKCGKPAFYRRFPIGARRRSSERAAN